MKKADYLENVGKNQQEWDIIPQNKVELLEDIEGFSDNSFPILGVVNKIAFGKDSKCINKAWVESVTGLAYKDFYQDTNDDETKSVLVQEKPIIPAPISKPIPAPVIPKPEIVKETIKEVEEIQQEDLKAAAEKFDEILEETQLNFLCDKFEQTGEECVEQCKFCANAELNDFTLKQQKEISKAFVEEVKIKHEDRIPTEKDINYYKNGLFKSFGYEMIDGKYRQKDMPNDFETFTEEELKTKTFNQMMDVFKPMEIKFRELNYNATDGLSKVQEKAIKIDTTVQTSECVKTIEKEEFKEIVEKVELQQETSEELFPDDLPEKPVEKLAEKIKEKVEEKSVKTILPVKKEEVEAIKAKTSIDVDFIDFSKIPTADVNIVAGLESIRNLRNIFDLFDKTFYAVSAIKSVLEIEASSEYKLENIKNIIDNHAK